MYVLTDIKPIIGLGDKLKIQLKEFFMAFDYNNGQSGAPNHPRPLPVPPGVEVPLNIFGNIKARFEKLQTPAPVAAPVKTLAGKKFIKPEDQPMNVVQSKDMEVWHKIVSKNQVEMDSQLLHQMKDLDHQIAMKLQREFDAAPPQNNVDADAKFALELQQHEELQLKLVKETEEGDIKIALRIAAEEGEILRVQVEKKAQEEKTLVEIKANELGYEFDSFLNMYHNKSDDDLKLADYFENLVMEQFGR